MAKMAPPELLTCIVPPDWALAVAGVNTDFLEGCLARPDLWYEIQLLKKLLYKNANQHRGSLHFQHLKEIPCEQVVRLLALLESMQLRQHVGAFHAAFHAAKQRGALPTGSVLMAHGADQRRIPSHGSAVALLRTLHAACCLAEQLAPAVHRAALQLLAQLAHSFFMPFSLTSLAALSRIQVLTGQLLLDIVRAYNVLAEAAALLPSAANHGSGAAGEAGGQPAQLLRALWRGGLPMLQAVPCHPGDSLAEQAAAACVRHSVHVVQQQSNDAAAAGQGQAGVPAKRARRRGGAAPAPVLAVVEDRGVPISREAFAAAAALGPAGAGAQAAGQEPAAEDALLLGVVEDTVAEVAEDESGVVASLMEGEARGHLYRRAACLGLGATDAGSQGRGRPAASAAGSGPDGTEEEKQQEERQQQLREQQREQVQAASASDAARAPSATAAPAGADVGAGLAPLLPVAPKPAFVAISMPPLQPAAARPSGAPGATPLPRGAAAPLQKAPGPLGGTAAKPAGASSSALPALAITDRKRKKAGTPSQQQQQQQGGAAAAAAAAQPPRSWEDWLAPLGGAATVAAPPALPKQQQQQQGKRRKGR